MPKRNHEGYVFFEGQNYLQKIGTKQYFVYNPTLAERSDMVLYDPFQTNPQQVLMKAPGVDDAEHCSNKTKEFIGLTREEIRETVKDMNRKQRMYWAIDLFFQQMPIHDLTQLHPSRIEIMKIIGPPVSGDDLLHALDDYRANPHIDYLLKEALKPVAPAPEETEATPNDLDTTPDPDVE